MTSKNPKKFLVKNVLVTLCMVLIINTIPSMGQKLPDSIQINQVLKAADRIVNRDIRDSINFEDILELDLVYSHMNDTSYLVEASRYLGIYYRSIFAFDDSEKYLLKGLELAKQTKNWDDLMEIYKELITVYRTTNRLDKVKEAIDSSMVIAKKYDMQSKMLIPLMELALYYSYDTADYEKGITYCEQFLEKVEQLRDADVDDKMLKYRMRTESVIVKIELAKCYIKTGKKMHLVLPLLDEARAFFGQYGDQEKLTRIYAEYLDYYIKKGDSKMMLAYLDKYIYHDKLSKQQIMDRSNEVTKYVSSLLNIKRKLEVSTLENKKLSLERWVIIAFFIIVVLVAAIYYRFIMRNTRIQRELNKSLIVQNELLETVNKEKAKFFSILSHELRTPIYAITGLTSVMNTKKVDSQQIKAIKHSGNYLLFLINNILTFSSFESPTGTTQTKKLPFNLSKVMNNIVDSSMYFASQYNINIKLNMDWQGDYWVKGDAQKLTQVLLNLIVNSIKYSQNNEVEINVFKTDKSSSHSNLTFEVKDNGVGIPKEKQKKLFEFEEKDTTGVPPKNPFNLHGMGLGLFVVNKLVSEMDSEIQVESEVNKGTIFSFELTLEKTNPVQTKVHMDNASQGIFADILVVDDNKTNLLVVKKMLEKLSYTCYTAKDTDDVVSIILNSNIRLVLMDLNMPNINGYELSKRIKEKVNVHIIAHTAVIEEELDVGLLNESGIEGYIIKPYTVDSLKKMLEDTLN